MRSAFIIDQFFVYLVAEYQKIVLGSQPGHFLKVVPGQDSACRMMEAGQVFLADYAKPEGFCDEAWKAIYQYVFALAHGAGDDVFYYGDWIRTPGVAICSCNDGLRPVIFKLEATDETSVIDYTPVR